MSRCDVALGRDCEARVRELGECETELSAPSSKHPVEVITLAFLAA